MIQAEVENLWSRIGESLMRRILASMCTIAAAVFLSSNVGAIPPAQNVVQAGAYEASLQVLTSGSAGLVLRTDGSTTEYSFDVAVTSLKAAAHSPSGRVTIVAETDGGMYVMVVAPASATTVAGGAAASAAMSDNGRFILWDRRQPAGGPPQSSEYRLVDVDALPLPADATAAPLGGEVVYPTTGTNPHIRASTISSVGDSTFAFLDLSSTATVVAIRATPGEAPSVMTRPLTATDLVDPAQLDGAVLPATLAAGPTISRVPGEGLVVRLDFAGPSPEHTGRSARLRIW
ncbi:MAG TPA: hypothetical protein VGD94_20405 [Vicinamibacterales bacterium]